ncbi:MAG: hypothetical protein Q4F21_12595 [Lachnospiraceae bacterium]|nr:hypothetical protein [Lachnospiraceae bacterium]
MRNVTYECRILTPMFIHGAGSENSSRDGRVKMIYDAQLLAIAFKSSMRFWWRALQSEDGAELLEKEKKLFGGVQDKDSSGGRCPFDISVESNLSSEQKRPLPHSSQKKFTTGAFAENGTFSVKFLARKRNCDLKFYMSLFELASLLGGVGQRARRGAGSYVIENRIDGDGNSVNPFGNDDLKKCLLERMYSIAADPGKIQSPAKKQQITCSGAGALCKIRKVDFVVSADSTGADIFKHISDVSHKVRNPLDSIYKGLKTDEVNRYSGMALGHVDKGRLASPVTVSVTEILGKKYILVVTLTGDCDVKQTATSEQAIIHKIQERFILELSGQRS